MDAQQELIDMCGYTVVADARQRVVDGDLSAEGACDYLGIDRSNADLVLEMVDG